MMIHRRRRKLSKRYRLLLWTLVGILIPVFYLVCILLRGAAPIRISPETTFLTSPVYDSGFVDFTEEFNRCLQHGVDDAATLDASAITNGVTLLQQAGTVQRTANGIVVVQWTPVLNSQLDSFVELLQRNQGAVLLPEASRKGSFRHPFTGNKEFIAINQVAIRLFQDVHGLLRSRISFRITAGDVKSALQDFEAQAELQRFLFRRRTILTVLMGLTSQREMMDDMATYAASGKLSPTDCRHVVNSVPRIQYADLRNSARMLRLQQLANVFAFHTGRHLLPGLVAIPTGSQRLLAKLQARWVLSWTDWNFICEQINVRFDKIEADLAMSYSISQAAGDLPLVLPITPPKEAPATTYRASERGMTDAVREWSVAAAEREWSLQLQAVHRVDRQRRLLQVAIELFDYRESFGEFPQTIEQLKLEVSSDVGPAYKHEINYQSGGTNFRLAIGDDDQQSVLTTTDGKPEFVDSE